MILLPPIGVECIDRLIFGIPEMTLNHPSIMNANRDTNINRIPVFPK